MTWKSWKRLQHWAVKLHAPPYLITIDFFEREKHGSFCVEIHLASLTEIDMFLKYPIKYTNSKTNEIHKRSLEWKRLVCVVPVFKNNLVYFVNDESKIPIAIEAAANYAQKSKRREQHKNSDSHSSHSNSNNSNSNHSHSHGCEHFSSPLEENSNMETIDINKYVCDVGDFLQNWYEKTRKYDPLDSNCQLFAFDLFEFLVKNTKFDYKIDVLRKYFQSPLHGPLNQNKKKSKNKNKHKNKHKHKKYGNNKTGRVTSFGGSSSITESPLANGDGNRGTGGNRHSNYSFGRQSHGKLTFIESALKEQELEYNENEDDNENEDKDSKLNNSDYTSLHDLKSFGNYNSLRSSDVETLNGCDVDDNNNSNNKKQMQGYGDGIGNERNSYSYSYNQHQANNEHEEDEVNTINEDDQSQFECFG